jgi:GNAT superfamily N-acetyltransferase
MRGEVEIRQARTADVDTVSSILLEAVAWLDARGVPMWRPDEVRRESIATAVDDGLFFLAEVDGDVVGTIAFQLTDAVYWPDASTDDSAYLHRLAVRRSHAGRGVSDALLHWARRRAARLGCRYLRLDCETGRSRLRALYENFGFEHHSDRQVGPDCVSRYQLTLQRSRARAAEMRRATTLV